LLDVPILHFHLKGIHIISPTPLKKPIEKQDKNYNFPDPTFLNEIPHSKTRNKKKIKFLM
jgi:hypothetical protein